MHYTASRLFTDSLGYEIFTSHDRRVDNFGLRLELSAESTGDRFDASRFKQQPEFFTDYLTDPVSTDPAQPYTGADVEDETQALSLRYLNSDLAIGELEVQGYYTNTERTAAFVPAGIANPLYYPVSPTNLTQSPSAQTRLDTTTYGVRTTVRSDLSTIAAGAKLTWGFDIGKDDVSQNLPDGTEIIAPMDQRSMATFAQLDIPIGARFDLSAGVRYERFDLDVSDFVRPDAVSLQFGPPVLLPSVNVTGGDFDYDATVFNIGGVYHLTDSTDIFAGFSQGFSLPDVGASTRRAMPANPFAPGQTISYEALGIEAQIVDTHEIGARHRSGAFSIEASGFYATSDDGTVFFSDSNNISQQQEKTWGGELIADYQVNPDLNIGLAASFTEGRFDEDDDGSYDAWLPNNRISAPVKVTLYTDYVFANGLRVAGELVYTGKRDNKGYAVVEDTTTVNARLAKQIGQSEFSFAIDNLFDTDQLNPTATSVRNIPTASEGRRVLAGYSITF